MEVLLERLVKGANEIAADRADKSLGPAHLYASFVSQLVWTCVNMSGL